MRPAYRAKHRAGWIGRLNAEVTLGVQTVLMWIAGVSLLLAFAFSGALNSGDRIRLNYLTEQPEDRSLCIKAAVACLAVSVVAGLLAWAL